MKKLSLLFVFITVTTAINANANESSESDSIIYVSESEALPDSILYGKREIHLNEITIKGATVIRKSDRDLLIPTTEQIKLAKNGTQLLGNMQIPGIMINSIDNSISLVGNGKLDIRINGRPVDVNEVKSINPQNVIRVEYHGNPSLRYGDAEAVIDFIVRVPSSGGNLTLDINPSLNKGWGQYYARGSVNHKESEFSLSYNFSPRWNFDYRRDNKEYYNLPNGDNITRIETGLPGDYQEFGHWAQANYNLVKSDKLLFSVSLFADIYNIPIQNYNGILNATESNPINIMDHNYYTSASPSIDSYFQYNINKNQLLMANLVGGYNKTNSSRYYSETSNDQQLVDINTNINGNEYSLVGEVGYEIKWDKSRFNGGIKQIETWNTTDYVSDNVRKKMQLSETYLYAEYWSKLSNKFDYTVGVGMSRYNINDNNVASTSSILFRPKASIRYNINDKSSLRFEFSNRGVAPSLSQLSDVEQKIDQYQVGVGNPNLKTFQIYQLKLEYQYSKGIFYAKFGANYWNAPKAIMDEKYWSNDKIICTFNNQRRLQELKFNLDFRLHVIKDWVTVAGTVGWHRIISNGNNYTHCYNNMWFMGDLQVTHWNFVLSAQMMTNYNTLWGETLTGGENIHMISLRYNYKDMSFGAGMILPFVNNYKRTSENWNKYAGYERDVRIKSVEQLVKLSFSYNISWGRKAKSAEKKIYNTINNESVKAVGK